MSSTDFNSGHRRLFRCTVTLCLQNGAKAPSIIINIKWIATLGRILPRFSTPHVFQNDTDLHHLRLMVKLKVDLAMQLPPGHTNLVQEDNKSTTKRRLPTPLIVLLSLYPRLQGMIAWKHMASTSQNLKTVFNQKRKAEDLSQSSKEEGHPPNFIVKIGIDIRRFLELQD